ncbi:hypothetical protein [Lacticaseibacillus thailandensis]|uniref:Uncharacterized protein n=1 Tax=Lacticaseibacillus thailandensis DSM 22698 = JCM 13996 TaxID=1423810 RepID=A0A0R2C6M9_9LACO|nr:hypothetical protein [Lacticaseibacillus thailandensis]KRM86610.1 hypothetical protein FD19_GL001801 [Lacticaseibacillus thailandensis DSM 22698 = JCM 13996]
MSKHAAHVAKSRKKSGWGIVIAMVIVAAIVIVGCWYATTPTSFMERWSTISFGIVFTFSIMILTVLDGRARTRGVRFFVDWIGGTVLLVLAHVYMIGITWEWKFLGYGTLVIAILALFAAWSLKPVATKSEFEEIK